MPPDPAPLIDSLPLPAWVAGPDGDTTRVNRRLADYLGAAGDWWAAVHPDDRAAAVASWRDAVRAGGEFRAEFRLRRHDDAYRWQDGRADPVRAPDGTVAHWVGVLTDADDRRRAEARFQTIIERSLDAVILYGPDGGIRYASPSSARLIGYDPAELAGRCGFEFVHPADVARVRAEFERLLEQPAATAVAVYRARHKDGNWRWLEARAVNLLAESDVGAVAATFRDVTDREQADAVRRRTQVLFRAFMDATPAVAFIKNADGRYVYANRRWEEQFTPPRRDWLGRPDVDFWPPETAAAFRASDLAALEPGHVAEIEEVVATRDGTKHFLALKFPVEDEAGRRAVGGVVVDVTERRRLENLLRDAAKMEAVGRLAGGVAHDFNNLLTVINGYADVLLGTLDPADPAWQMVDEVRLAGDRAAALTHQLLAFSRRQILQRKVLDLNAVVTDAARLLRRLVGEDVALVLRPAAALRAVEADPGQLEQVVMNLVVNARDAMPTGGTVTVATADAGLGAGVAADGAAVRPGEYVVLSVSDTGSGMTDEVRRHVFEPFFTTKGSGRGTGLGLATVYGIVTQSGGHIDVDTAVGRGTTFRVYLPAAAGPVPSAAGASGIAALPCGTETILVVEDEPGVRSLTQLLLTRLGYTVLTAADADEAAAVARGAARPPDLLLTDVVLPGSGGRVVAERLRRAYPALRVLFMSGYADDAVLRHGVAADRFDFLAKPYRSEELARKVREVLDE